MSITSGTISSPPVTHPALRPMCRAARWRAGMSLAALSGAMTGLAGLALALVNAFGVALSTTSLYSIATLLIGASFVFFGLAAHCLDRADAEDKASRIEYCRRHGLKD
ncbi:MAG TPA: hypothetical protein VNA22_06430 [Pyrinomonadaceae bacterium]|nr:hypothetical protein [Pyrinomonadaceae bacterium]